MRANKPFRSRRRRCLHCHGLFDPDTRTTVRQRYCSRAECQTARQRKNEKDWRSRNPDCLAYQREQTRQWHRAHPAYSLQRRADDRGLLQRNRDQTMLRMRRIRLQRLFDKSKVILTQLIGIKRDKCYLARGSRWLHVRLTKASPLSKLGSMRDNRDSCKRIPNRLPRGKLYDLSSILE